MTDAMEDYDDFQSPWGQGGGASSHQPLNPNASQFIPAPTQSPQPPTSPQPQHQFQAQQQQLPQNQPAFASYQYQPPLQQQQWATDAYGRPFQIPNAFPNPPQYPYQQQFSPQPQSIVRLPKPKAPHVYDGERTTSAVDSWIFAMNTYLNKFTLTENQQVTQAASYLGKQANVWFQSLAEKPATYAAFKVALNANFRPVTAVKDAEEAMQMLTKEETKDMVKYVAKFRELAAQIPNFYEVEKWRKFKEGLPKKVKRAYTRFQADVDKLSFEEKVSWIVHEASYMELVPANDPYAVDTTTSTKSAHHTAANSAPSTADSTVPMDMDAARRLRGGAWRDPRRRWTGAGMRRRSTGLNVVDWSDEEESDRYESETGTEEENLTTGLNALQVDTSNIPPLFDSNGQQVDVAALMPVINARDNRGRYVPLRAQQQPSSGCFVCGKTEHYGKDCPFRFDQRKNKYPDWNSPQARQQDFQRSSARK